MAIRSGRFRLGEEATIVLGGEGCFYRVLNSSDHRPDSSNNLKSFDIKTGQGGGGLKSVTVNPRFSLDIKLTGSVNNLVVTPADDMEVDGIYDLLRVGQDIRSGRFKFETAPSERHQIISTGGSGLDAIYRLFNSGEHPIDLYEEGMGDPFLTVKPDESRDFLVDRKDIFVHSDEPFEGIYDLVQTV